MHRFVLTDAQWTKMAPLCLGKARHPGRTGGDGRSFLEALLRSARGGLHGEIYRLCLAPGTASSRAPAIG
jgi:transposase